MPKPGVGALVTVAIWVAVVGGLWAHFDRQIENGREIRLRAQPVDPRALLRGDYVILRYDLSTLESVPEEARYRLREGGEVFVPLSEVAGEWRPGPTALEPPAGGLFLRGRIRRIRDSALDVEYGIERFFVPEGEGRAYEDARNAGRLYAVLRVGPRGVARLEALEIAPE